MRQPGFRLLAGCLLLVAQPAGFGSTFDGLADTGDGLPRFLHETGLYAAWPSRRVSGRVAGFSPRYPLWSDGAEKRRWLYLPAGAAIDTSNPDAWQFPRGTKLWKEFGYGGRAVETRYIERGRDGRWRFATYVWNSEGTLAVLDTGRGIPALHVSMAPQGRYTVPSRSDCLACHGSTTTPVLGLTAWQRDANIPASTELERAALGYLHGNCAHCHNATASRVPVQLTLAQRVGDPEVAYAQVMRSLVGAPTRYQPTDMRGTPVAVVPGEPGQSVLAMRMRSAHKQSRMPPLGTNEADPAGLALIDRWISSMQPLHLKETTQ